MSARQIADEGEGRTHGSAWAVTVADRSRAKPPRHTDRVVRNRSELTEPVVWRRDSL